MITVVNKYKHVPTINDVYIGRGSILGNPFTSIKNKETKAIFSCDTREESIELFEKYLSNELKKKNQVLCSEMNRLWVLSKTTNINLVCFCKPKSCHGDIIKKILINKI
jgi:hypothetical protein